VTTLSVAPYPLSATSVDGRIATLRAVAQILATSGVG
jgi:hypothetical protein